MTRPWRRQNLFGVIVRGGALGFALPLLADASVRAVLAHYRLPLDGLPWAQIHLGEAVPMAFACFFLGLWAPTPHPVTDSRYARWLMTTPWRAGMPLPLGSPLPGWREAVFLAIVCAGCALYCGQSAAWPLVAFSAGYSLANLALFRATPWPFTPAVVFLFAALTRVFPSPPAMMAVALAMLAVACWGTRLSLDRYPWGLDEPKVPEPSLGPVFSRLGPAPIKNAVTWRTGLTTAVLVGWILYCALSRSGELALPDSFAGALVFAAVLGVLLSVIRFGIYCGGHQPPLSVRGRIATGHLIIPGYDYVLLAPLAAAVLAPALSALLHRAGASPAAAFGLSAAAVLIVLLLARPTLSEWKLTGHHRMVLLAGPSNPKPARNREAA